MAWTLNDWNDILNRVNALATNPPEACSYIAPLPLATDPHIWSFADIRAAQNILKQICPDNEFVDPIRPYWSQATVDELNDAIENGWCACDTYCWYNILSPCGGVGCGTLSEVNEQITYWLSWAIPAGCVYNGTVIYPVRVIPSGNPVRGEPCNIHSVISAKYRMACAGAYAQAGLWSPFCAMLAKGDFRQQMPRPLSHRAQVA